MYISLLQQALPPFAFRVELHVDMYTVALDTASASLLSIFPLSMLSIFPPFPLPPSLFPLPLSPLSHSPFPSPPPLFRTPPPLSHSLLCLLSPLALSP